MRRTALQHSTPPDDAIGFPLELISYAMGMYYRPLSSLRMIA